MPDQSPSTNPTILAPDTSAEMRRGAGRTQASPPPGKQKTHWIAATLVLVVIIVGGAYAWQWFHTASPAAGPQGLVLYGNVEIRQVDLAFGVEGTIAKVLVDEGDRVEGGQTLASLEQQPFVEGQASATAALKSGQARLEELEAGFRPQEIDEARASVASREATLANADINLKRQRELLQGGHTSQQQYDAADMVDRTADANLRDARAVLAMRLEGTRHEQITQQRAEVEARRAALGIQDYRLLKSTLVAPNAGIVLTRIREPGAVVIPNSPVLTVSVIDPVWVRTYVDEPNLSRMVPGAEVRVQTDATPTKVYNGRVGYISPTAEFTPRTVEAPSLRTDLVYRVRIIVDNPDRSLRQGMPATVTVMPVKP
jgi:HlyD family secretion protein